MDWFDEVQKTIDEMNKALSSEQSALRKKGFSSKILDESSLGLNEGTIKVASLNSDHNHLKTKSLLFWAVLGIIFLFLVLAVVYLIFFVYRA